MAQDEPGKDISYTRPIIGVPSALDGLNSTNNTHHNQDCEVSTTFPGGYVVTISGGIDILAAPPMKGFLLQIDARASVKDITVAPTTGIVAPGTPLATVLAGTYSLCVSDGVGWAAIPDTGTFGAPATATNALVTGVVDANVANLAIFAVAGAGRDGITYAQGNVVLLMAQAAPAQNGPYVVGTVAGGNAPLTRPSWWATGASIPDSFEFFVGSAGTVYHNLIAYASSSGGVVDTNDPALLFRRITALILSNQTFFENNGFLPTGLTHPGAGRVGIHSVVGVNFSRATINVTAATGASTAQLTFDTKLVGAHDIEIESWAVAAATDESFYILVTQ